MLNPSHTDAGGYMGDWKRGAPLGRSGFPTRADHLDILRAELRLAVESLEYFESYIARGVVPSHLDSMDQVKELAGKRRDEVSALRLQIDLLERAPAPKWYLQRVALDSGGYDRGGAYWGFPADLWVAFTASGEGVYVRAGNREAAKFLVRESSPDARFFK